MTHFQMIYMKMFVLESSFTNGKAKYKTGTCLNGSACSPSKFTYTTIIMTGNKTLWKDRLVDSATHLEVPVHYGWFLSVHMLHGSTHLVEHLQDDIAWQGVSEGVENVH